jgi:hypothetical protein
MKKFLAFAFSVIALSSVAMAQSESAEATEPALANVLVPITVDGVRPMLLGDLVRSMDSTPVLQSAEFYVRADDGDLLMMHVNGGQYITLQALHTQVTEEPDQEPTLGPEDYQNDQNGHEDALSTEITVVPQLWYRFIDNDEQNKVTWGLPTWTAGNGYCDEPDGIERCILPGTLPPGIGQIHVYVDGKFTTRDDQQRGEYVGDVTLSVEYY